MTSRPLGAVLAAFLLGIVALAYAAFRTMSPTPELLVSPETYVAPPSPVAAAAR